ncbi:MAG: hypothetical protein LQ347_006846, partial [Umbilicaria vellea]
MPVWETCIDGIYAFYDPPFVLHSANGLVAPGPTTTAPITTTTTPASAGPTPAPQTVDPTTTASPVLKAPVSSSPTSTPVPAVFVQPAGDQPSSKDTNAGKPANDQPASNVDLPINLQPISTSNGGGQSPSPSSTPTFHLQQGAGGTTVNPPA